MTSPSSIDPAAPAIAVIGARRVRQGNGMWIAAILSELGANVSAVLGTTPETAAAAADTLKQRFQIEARSYHDFADMTAREKLDAVVIASPAATHATYLDAALQAGLHVLCEKPFVWNVASPAEQARRTVSAFRAKNLLLMENVQWPYTLPHYEALHPGVYGPRKPVTHFGMLLSPASEGLEMVVDCMSHPFSLLGVVAPALKPRVRNIEIIGKEPGTRALQLRFEYCHDSGNAEVSVELRFSAEQPRPAWYSINRRAAKRTVQMPSYDMFFQDGTKQVPLPDPMKLLLQHFLKTLREVKAGARPPSDTNIVTRMELLKIVADAYALA